MSGCDLGGQVDEHDVLEGRGQDQRVARTPRAAQRMTVLAGAVSNSLLTRARSSVLIGWSPTLISVTATLTFSGAIGRLPRESAAGA